MEKFTLWLLLGNIGYSLALAIRLYQLDTLVKHNKSAIPGVSGFLRGLGGMLLGPFTIILVILLAFVYGEKDDR